jgi:predicted ferric reductase
MTPFVAGGVGITPLLASVHTLDLSPARFKLFWTIRSADVDLAIDTLQWHSELAKLTEVFLTGSSTQDETLDAKQAQLRSLGVQVHGRRMTRSDIDAISAQTWYLCASKQLRNEILSWLEGQKVVFEDFDY